MTPHITDLSAWVVAIARLHADNSENREGVEQ
jgi:hypothetical protein